MKELKGSKTEQNLQTAFAGESMARNKYSYFAKKAKEDGYIQISKFFKETAGNEKEHAKIWFKYLDGINDTVENLKAAIETEHYENSTMYPSFADVAREEGFKEIAEHFERVAHIEKMHAARYQRLLDDILDERVLFSESETVWECSKCGYTVTGNNPPEKCPFCSHPKEYFIRQALNY